MDRRLYTNYSNTGFAAGEGRGGGGGWSIAKGSRIAHPRHSAGHCATGETEGPPRRKSTPGGQERGSSLPSIEGECK